MNWSNVFVLFAGISAYMFTTFLYESSTMVTEYRAAEKIKIECEKSLPRDKYCEIKVIVVNPND